MPSLGQASGGFTESSSALRLLHVGVRNSTGNLTNDSFTQTNPPIVTTSGTISENANTGVFGVLSGSVAFSRPDVGAKYVGGNVESLATSYHELLIRPMGLFINNANGNPLENQPAVASGVGPYVSAQGTYGSQLFETQVLDGTNVTGMSTGDDVTYLPGMELVASRNGYLMPRMTVNTAGAALTSLDKAEVAAEVEHGHSASTTIGIVKVQPDSAVSEIWFDQRI